MMKKSYRAGFVRLILGVACVAGAQSFAHAAELEERRPLSLPEAGERTSLPLSDPRGRERFMPTDTRKKESERLRGVPIDAGKWSGFVALESRLFAQEALFPSRAARKLPSCCNPSTTRNGTAESRASPSFLFTATISAIPSVPISMCANSPG